MRAIAVAAQTLKIRVPKNKNTRSKEKLNNVGSQQKKNEGQNR